MNSKETTKTTKNSLSFISLKLGSVAIVLGLLFSVFTNNHRQYSAGNAISKEKDEKDNDAYGMLKFFFNARKNITTNKLDYKSMFEATAADREMATARFTHATTAVPSLNWDSYGPTATGGRTRAILIDNQDPTHQTIFAGGVTGGIWKSTDGGSHWGSSISTIAFSQDDQMANMNICCIAQDSKGVIYVGTGEGFVNLGEEFSTGEVGGGIFKSTDDGATWRLLPKTAPAANSAALWAFTNRIAIQPNNFKTLYASTNYGLYISRDSGATWRSAYNLVTNKKISGAPSYNSLDVKVSGDGSVIIADVSGFGYVCNPLSGNDSSFTQIKYTGVGRLPGNAVRIEFAIAPTNPNHIYASDIQGSAPYGAFGTTGSTSGIFMSTNGGTYWYNIGPGGSMAFDPYISAFDQCGYDNTLAVFPNNENYLILGGTTFYKWNTTHSGDTVGEWNKISHYGGGPSDPLWVHADDHALVFDPSNPNVLFLGCDGGVFKSTNATNAETSSGAMTFGAYNRNYAVTQYYHVCYSPQVNYVNVNYGNGTKVEGIGMGGGAQDNGSPYMTGNGFYPNDGNDMTGGDGNGCAVSQLNPNIAYFSIDYGSFLGREGNLSTLSGPTDAYTAFQGRCTGADIQAIGGTGAGSFDFPVALYENPYDLLNHDSIIFVAPKNYKPGDTIWPQSSNGPLYYPYVTPIAIAMGSRTMVPDRVVSRLAIGFSGKNYIWINGQGASNYSVLWKPIGGGLSKPTADNSASPIHALAWSADGDDLFVGDESGVLFRFSNLNAMDANNYCSGALFWDTASVSHVTGDTTVKSKQLASPVGGRDILSLGTDPKNSNNLMVTAGNYGSAAYVYYSTNAQSASPSFVSVQGNLPLMPVYSCIVDLRNSDGTYLTGSAMVATEHGIYSTDKLNGTSTVWVKNSNGLPNVMTSDIKQQNMPNYMCNNSGNIYVSTHGRGAWVSSTLQQLPTAVPVVKNAAVLDNLKVYPNPMTTQGNIEFDMTTSDDVTVRIYDIQGKEVKTMALGTQTPGNHIVPFETTNMHAGTYFATLTGSTFRKVCKFVVTK